MNLQQQLEAVLLVTLASILSAVIGLDRESRSPAGLRTHMLVGIGASLFTILSIQAFPGSDPARIASNIVVGIGFLGAGTILQRRGDIHNLTTAASIWATAAIGMAVGSGTWFLALCSTLLIWVVLRIIRRFEPEKMDSKTSKS